MPPPPADVAILPVMSLSKSILRVGTSWLLATAPLMLFASGCGGGGTFNPLPTNTPIPTATTTGTPAATATNTPVATATPAPTAVGTTALEFSSLGSGSNFDGTIYEQGWRFTPNRLMNVTALGFYDQLKNGLTTSHKVGIYDVNTQTLLASTTVLKSDALTGFFRFHSLSTPVTLTTGRDYYVVAVLNSGNDGFATGVDPITVNSAITFKGSASDIGGNINGNLVYPDSFLSGNKGNFGPTFRFN